MFKDNYTSKILDLKDPNIDFSDSTCDFIEIKGVKIMQISAVLKNKPDTCPYCNESKINIHGYKISKIKLISISGYDAVLALKKQRYRCQCCGKTFMANTNIVEKNSHISLKVKTAVLLELKNKISEKDIAKKYNISSNTVNRILKAYDKSYKQNFNYLPECLCFDEFKSTKSAEGAMSFIYIDGETHKILDILSDRRLSSLTKYFFNYSLDVRKNVKYIVIDMYSPYISLAKTCFPNAQIIFDRFHIVNLISRMLNKTRIKLMNKNKAIYNKLKRYWRLILMDEEELNYTEYFYCPCFRGRRTQKIILDWILTQDDELRATYRFYQNFLKALKNKNTKGLENAIANVNKKAVSSYMETAIKTIVKYFEYIKNAAKYKYSNGPIEGINNKIKVIKRISFGYRSFINFRTRIILVNNVI